MWDGPVLLNADVWLLAIVVIINRMSQVVVVMKIFRILEMRCLPIDMPFSFIATTLQDGICCHQHHGVLCILHFIDIEVLAIKYPRNGISIAYLFYRIFLPSQLFVNIIWTVCTFFNYHHCKTPNFSQFSDFSKNSKVLFQHQCPTWSQNWPCRPQQQYTYRTTKNLICYIVYLVWPLFSSANFIFKTIPLNPQQIAWYSSPNSQGFLDTNINPGQV